MISIKRSARWFLLTMAAVAAAAALASCAALREPCFWGCVAVDELPGEWSVTQPPRSESTAYCSRVTGVQAAACSPYAARADGSRDWTMPCAITLPEDATEAEIWHEARHCLWGDARHWLTSSPTRSDAMRRADARDRAIVEGEMEGVE
jgi:hypothetical protein